MSLHVPVEAVSVASCAAVPEIAGSMVFDGAGAGGGGAVELPTGADSTDALVEPSGSLTVMTSFSAYPLSADCTVYFADEPTNATDPLLSSIEDELVRRTLIAAQAEPGNPAVYRFDIVLQGDNETAFLDI